MDPNSLRLSYVKCFRSVNYAPALSHLYWRVASMVRKLTPSFSVTTSPERSLASSALSVTRLHSSIVICANSPFPSWIIACNVCDVHLGRRNLPPCWPIQAALPVSPSRSIVECPLSFISPLTSAKLRLEMKREIHQLGLHGARGQTTLHQLSCKFALYLENKKTRPFLFNNTKCDCFK